MPTQTLLQLHPDLTYLQPTTVHPKLLSYRSTNPYDMSWISSTFSFSSQSFVFLTRLLRYKCPNIRTSLFIPGHLLTPLFSNVTFPAIQKFFMPPVAPVTVVKKIIAVMDEQHSQTIMMPFYSNFMPLLPLLPSFVTDTLRSVSGVRACVYRLGGLIVCPSFA